MTLGAMGNFASLAVVRFILGTFEAELFTATASQSGTSKTNVLFELPSSLHAVPSVCLTCATTQFELTAHQIEPSGMHLPSQ